MYPTRLILQNFVSFEKIEYKFEQGPIAIIGDNRTQDDQAQNGTGKTSLLNGLFYGIYGQNLRQKEDKKLIRYGQNSAIIVVELYCPLRKETCEITREIKMKGSSTLKIRLNNKEISIPTVNEGNKWIYNWIEISAEDAKSYYIVTKTNYKSFFNCSNTDKLALIGRFINFSNIDKSKDIIEQNKEVISSEKNNIQKIQSSCEGKIELYREQIEKILNRNPEQEKNQKIEKIQSSIDRLNSDNKSRQDEIERYEIELKRVSDKYKQLSSLLSSIEEELKSKREVNFDDTFNEIDDNIREVNNDLKTNQSLLDSNNKIKQTYEEKLRKIETILAGVIECPNCHHRFLLDKNSDIQELESESKKIKTKIKSTLKEINRINQIVEELNSLMEECRTMRKQTEEEEKKLNEQKKQIQNKFKILKTDALGFENQTNELNHKINSLHNLITDSKETIRQYKLDIERINKTDISIDIDTSSQEKEIEKLEKQIEELQRHIEDKNVEMNNISCWTQRFKDFKMFLAMEQIRNVQQSTNEILQKMGSDMRLMIEGFKKNASGKVVEEITPYIFRDEMELYSYYSGGERVRMEIALIIALQQAINSTKKHGGLQFLFIDEILESADALGIENIVKSMEFLKQPILIITHVPRLNEDIHQLKVIKENGISRIEEVLYRD